MGSRTICEREAVRENWAHKNKRCPHKTTLPKGQYSQVSGEANTSSDLRRISAAQSPFVGWKINELRNARESDLSTEVN